MNNDGRTKDGRRQTKYENGSYRKSSCRQMSFCFTGMFFLQRKFMTKLSPSVCYTNGSVFKIIGAVVGGLHNPCVNVEETFGLTVN